MCAMHCVCGSGWVCAFSILNFSCLGKLGQGLTSVIHQVEEGLGLTDSEGPTSQDSGHGQGMSEDPGQGGETKPEGEQTGTTGNGSHSLQRLLHTPGL